MKRVIKYLVSLSLLVALFFGGFYLFSQHEQTQEAKAPKYSNINLIGIGDSLTYGVGDASGRGGYVGLIDPLLENQYQIGVNTQNFGKPGDRSDEVTSLIKQAKPLQTSLKQANVITMTVGGNDLLQLLRKNFDALMNNNLGPVMQTGGQTYENNLEQLFTTIRHYNKQAPIFIFGVYNPFYVYFPKLTALQDAINQWNQDTKAVVAKQPKTYFISINKRLSQGQYLDKSKAKLLKTSQTDLKAKSSKQLQTLIDQEGNKNDYLSSQDHFHPNVQGYQYMAQRLLAKMEKEQGTWLKKGN